MFTTRPTLALVLLLALLAGCGKRGPLYLPDERRPAQQAPEPEAQQEPEPGQEEPQEQDLPPPTVPGY